MTAGADNWQRLGDALIRRRGQIGYPRRAAFVRAKNVSKSNARILAAIENNERQSYDRETLIYFEDLYELETGSIRKVIDEGGELTPVNDVKIADLRPAESAERQELHRLVDHLPSADLGRVSGYLTAIVEQSQYSREH